MKSTVDDLLACYRLAGKLSRAHKLKLIALLSEDAKEKEAKKSGKKKIAKTEEPTN